jgi:HSP20 family protein
MGTLQQRFEVERPVSDVYDAFAQPASLLESLPGVARVSREMDDAYRLSSAEGSAGEHEIAVTSKTPYRRIEWRAAGGQWLGSVELEPLGPERTAVTLSAQSIGEGSGPSETLVQDAVQAIKRTLHSPRVRVTTNSRPQPRPESGEGKRFASEWRDTARSAFTRPTEFPFTLMRTISRQMDRVWGDVLRGTPISRLPQIVPGMPWNPNVEVCEQNDQVRVCIDVPGIDESRLQVEVDEGSLTVRGERQDERRSDPGHRRSELHYGAFTRRIPLPEGTDADGARAVLRNGVLEIRIPLRRRAPRRVPVQHVPQ